MVVPTVYHQRHIGAYLHGNTGATAKAPSRQTILVVRSNRYTKFMKAIGNVKKIVNMVAGKYLQHCVATYGIPYKLLTDNGPSSYFS